VSIKTLDAGFHLEHELTRLLDGEPSRYFASACAPEDATDLVAGLGIDVFKASARRHPRGRVLGMQAAQLSEELIRTATVHETATALELACWSLPSLVAVYFNPRSIIACGKT
jgi:hypothetical protein